MASLERFLIVDDAPAVRLLLRRLLNKYGVSEGQIQEVGDGKEVEARMKSFRPTVVLMDMEMPGMGGEEAGAKVLGAGENVRVVIVSGYDKQDPRVRRLVQMGAFDVLTKPVHATDVERLLAQLARDEPGLGRIA